MILRAMVQADIDQCIECFLDAYGTNYYRPEVYTRQGWVKWIDDPFIELLIFELDGEVAAVLADFWNQLGWIEYGGLAARKKFRGRGITKECVLRIIKNNMALLQRDYCIWTVPYAPGISNAAREANSIFGGINGMYQLDDRIVFSVYYGWNGRRILARSPGYIPPKMWDFFKEQEKFIGGKYRRTYGFKELKKIQLETTEQPQMDIPWSIYSYIINLKATDRLESVGDVTYRDYKAQKIIQIMDIKLPGNGLAEVLEKRKEGYVVDARILLASKDAPAITALLEKHGFCYSNLNLATVMLSGNQVVTTNKAQGHMPETYQTADTLQMTTPTKRLCTLINKEDPSKNEPNVERFLETYPQGVIEIGTHFS